nr:disease resistance RPP13-like protein 4 [Ipomoea batatas]
MELIRLGFIQPYYRRGDAQRLSNQGVVGACRVHPWIRRMLVSIAMDTQFFEFYGRQQLGGQEKNKISANPGFHGQPAHACLFWDEDAEQENFKFMRIIKILRWLKPALVVCEKEIINKEARILDDFDDEVKGYRHMQEVWDMLFAFRLLILCVSKLVVGDVRDRISPWDGDEKPEALLEKLTELETDIHLNQKDVQELFEKQNEMQSDLNKVLMWAKEQVHVLEMKVYHRKRNRQELQLTEQLFARYDLSGSSSSSSGPIHRQCGGKAPLLAIINVNQRYLNLEELLVFSGKLNKLRTLHLGMWNYLQGYIETENSLVLNALFQVGSCKHLKYLSLRGVEGITSLSPSISNSCNLQVLDLKDCYDLEEVPSEIGSLSKLTYFNVSGDVQRLKHSSVWVVVAKLKLLRTLKGIALTQQDDADLISQITPHNLMKLSIIVNFNFNEVCNLQRFSNLHALKITWSQEGDVVDRYGFELPPQLKKLQLKSYPDDQNWPAWLKRHPTLEILHFSYSPRITAFPDDLMLPKLQVLWLTNAREFDKSILELGMPRWFPSLRRLFDDYNQPELNKSHACKRKRINKDWISESRVITSKPFGLPFSNKVSLCDKPSSEPSATGDGG